MRGSWPSRQAVCGHPRTPPLEGLNAKTQNNGPWRQGDSPANTETSQVHKQCSESTAHSTSCQWLPTHTVGRASLCPATHSGGRKSAGPSVAPHRQARAAATPATEATPLPAFSEPGPRGLCALPPRPRAASSRQASPTPPQSGGGLSTGRGIDRRSPAVTATLHSGQGRLPDLPALPRVNSPNLTPGRPLSVAPTTSSMFPCRVLTACSVAARTLAGPADGPTGGARHTHPPAQAQTGCHVSSQGPREPCSM